MLSQPLRAHISCGGRQGEGDGGDVAAGGMQGISTSFVVFEAAVLLLLVVSCRAMGQQKLGSESDFGRRKREAAAGNKGSSAVAKAAVSTRKTREVELASMEEGEGEDVQLMVDSRV